MSFHVPELARDINHPLLGTTIKDGNNGAFHIESPEPGWKLALICSDGYNWEHVSIHAYTNGGKKQRIPTWKEMAYVKKLCWDGNDVVMQIYPKEKDFVNQHEFTLHWWRPTDQEIPIPPSIFVGIK